MKIPTVDPVGVLQVPDGYERRAPIARPLRVLAAVVLVAFCAVMTSTTVVSLGRYCLTTDAANTAALPGRPDPGYRP